MTALCFIDTETTSLSVEEGEIWEFGGIRVDDDGSERETTFFIEVDLGTADPYSLKIGQFHKRYKEGLAYDKFRAAKKIEAFTRDSVIVGNVISFDASRLEKLLRNYGQCPTWNYHIADVEAVGYGYVHAMQQAGDDFALLENLPPPPWSAEIVNQYLQVEPPSEQELHTALGDARYTKRLWEAMF